MLHDTTQFVVHQVTTMGPTGPNMYLHAVLEFLAVWTLFQAGKTMMKMVPTREK